MDLTSYNRRRPKLYLSLYKCCIGNKYNQLYDIIINCDQINIIEYNTPLFAIYYIIIQNNSLYLLHCNTSGSPPELRDFGLYENEELHGRVDGVDPYIFP
jgi:hypothetical protein